MIEYLKLFISLTSKVTMGVALFCLVSILTPSTFLSKINLLEIRAEYLPIIWIIFVASICLLISRSIFGLFPFFKGRLNGYIMVSRGKKRLKCLTSTEKKILLGYLKNDTMSQVFDCTDGEVLALEHENIIYQASALSREFTSFSYNIQPWAKQYLFKKPFLLKSATHNQSRHRT